MLVTPDHTQDSLECQPARIRALYLLALPRAAARTDGVGSKEQTLETKQQKKKKDPSYLKRVSDSQNIDWFSTESRGFLTKHTIRGTREHGLAWESHTP